MNGLEELAGLEPFSCLVMKACRIRMPDKDASTVKGPNCSLSSQLTLLTDDAVFISSCWFCERIERSKGRTG